VQRSVSVGSAKGIIQRAAAFVHASIYFARSPATPSPAFYLSDVQENLLLIMAARLAFIAEWLDPNSGVLWRYQLFYYPATGEIEMVITGSTHQVACWLYER
jgi:hypothetical protein